MLSDRERRRIESTKRNHGDDFYSKNGRHSAKFTKSKFNSQTGREAALKRHELERKKRAQAIKEAEEDLDGTI